MVWVIVFVAIAVGGLVMLASYAVWLAHKVGDVLGEVSVLASRLGQLADLASQIRMTESPQPGTAVSGPTGRVDLDEGALDVR